ncbi:MAG: DUF2971 domain-containing protein [Fluviicola sp.]|nr:DUF2971 domain-containing protein [Fluviicola sp.]
MNNDIPEVFKSQDTIYHYCSTNTAIEHILFEKQLRLSPRKSSFDPIENLKVSYGQGGVYSNEFEMQSIEQRTETGLKRLIEEVIGRYEGTKQLCFCKNAPIEKFQSHINLPEEYYGFLKPRMWDQYGNRYQGVCLSFSRDKLIEIHNELNHDINYVAYSHLSNNHLSFHHHELDSKGYDKYYSSLVATMNMLLSRKHQDYSGENEFRMYSFSDKEYEYIDISEAINGIIVSKRNLSKFANDQLVRYSKDMGIQMLYLHWSSSGISIRTLEDYEKTYKMVVPSLDAKK